MRWQSADLDPGEEPDSGYLQKCLRFVESFGGAEYSTAA